MDKKAVVILFMSLIGAGNAGILDGILGFTCVASNSYSAIQICQDEYSKSLAPYTREDGSVYEIAYCCAITTLRYCISDEIEKKCGDKAGKIVDSLVGEAVKGLNQVATVDAHRDTCRGDEFYFRRESPICWPVWGHAIGAAFLLGILALCICCCCVKCCRN